ncbi:hypothetical protein [Micromonospora sp. NBC_00421]|uniref:hypothetical protein n=1 Tax=Micromonospora sp. NBC_00421 TaxID=2975976 RepID=UPI002E24B3AE
MTSQPKSFGRALLSALADPQGYLASATRLNAGPGYTFTYTVAHEAWWWPARRKADPLPTLMVAKAADGGGCAWEFAVVHKQFTAVDQAAIQVRVFNDGFAAYTEMAPFFAALADQQPTTLDGVRAILDGLGVVDATERTNPND